MTFSVVESGNSGSEISVNSRIFLMRLLFSISIFFGGLIGGKKLTSRADSACPAPAIESQPLSRAPLYGLLNAR